MKIAVSAASFGKSAPLMAELEALGHDIVANRSGKVLKGEELLKFFRDAQASVAIVGTEPIDATVLDAAAPALRAVVKYGVGLDNIDQPLLKARGLDFFWTGGVNKRGVAELALTFALGHFRNVFRAVQTMREGLWQKDGGVELSSRKVGIVGFGYTGSEFAKILRALGCEVLVHDILDKAQEAKAIGATLASYEDILASCDVVSFHVPLTEATTKMFGLEQIEKVRSNTLIINTSRGPVIDFESVCSAVSEGRLGGFAADVFEEEPYDASPWRRCDRLYFTPHIAGNSREAVMAMGRAAIGALGCTKGPPVHHRADR